MGSAVPIDVSLVNQFFAVPIVVMLMEVVRRIWPSLNGTDPRLKLVKAAIMWGIATICAVSLQFPAFSDVVTIWRDSPDMRPEALQTVVILISSTIGLTQVAYQIVRQRLADTRNTLAPSRQNL